MGKKCEPSTIYSHLQAEYIAEIDDPQPQKHADKLNMLLLIQDDGIGDRTAMLATSLMTNLIKGIADKPPYPSVIILMNRGVFLALQDSNALDELRHMESQGVLILSNCTCLDYYKAMDKLAVGGITNTYHIAELIKLAKNTVTF